MENRELNRALIKDYDLPIAFYEEPYFSYFAKLLEPYFQIEEKIKLLNLSLSKTSISEFLVSYKKISEEMIKTISETSAYKDFNQQIFNLKTPPKGFEQAQRLYTSNHTGSQIYSIDLIKANFSVLKAFNPEIVLNAQSYGDLFTKFSDCKYLDGSKKVRQVIFGNLNPKRQQTLQRHYMSWVKHYLTEMGLKEDSILLSSSDELVFKTEDFSIETKIKEAFSQPETKALVNDYRVNSFNLKIVHKDFDFCVKEYLNPQGKIEFKNVPQQYLAQVIKFYEKRPIEELDRKIVIDGKVATFDEPILK